MTNYLERLGENPSIIGKFRAHRPYVDESSGDVFLGGKKAYRLNLNNGWDQSQLHYINEHNQAHAVLDKILGDSQKYGPHNWNENDITRAREASETIRFTNSQMPHGKYRGAHEHQTIKAEVTLEVFK